jgi:hypothetical protein
VLLLLLSSINSTLVFYEITHFSLTLSHIILIGINNKITFYHLESSAYRRLGFFFGSTGNQGFMLDRQVHLLSHSASAEGQVFNGDKKIEILWVGCLFLSIPISVLTIGYTSISLSKFENISKSKISLIYLNLLNIIFSLAFLKHP